MQAKTAAVNGVIMVVDRISPVVLQHDTVKKSWYGSALRQPL
jgi:hypothetical protein